MFKASINTLGGQVFDAMQVTGARFDAQQTVLSVESEAAARTKSHAAEKYILASGGLLGGGMRADYDGSLCEEIFDLAVDAPHARGHWFNERFLSAEPHPIFTCGLRVNQQWQPVDFRGDVLFSNLYAAGVGLAGGDFLRQRALDGAAWVSGYLAGDQAWPGQADQAQKGVSA